MERITSPSNYPPRVGKLRPEQIAQRSTWGRVPDRQSAMAAAHIVHVMPAGASTVTHLNPMDPGTVSRTSPDDRHDGYIGWLERDGDRGRLTPARFGR